MVICKIGQSVVTKYVIVINRHDMLYASKIIYCQYTNFYSLQHNLGEIIHTVALKRVEKSFRIRRLAYSFRMQYKLTCDVYLFNWKPTDVYVGNE